MRRNRRWQASNGNALPLPMLIFVCAYFAGNLLGAEPENASEKAPLPPAAERHVDFEKDIAPLLADRCYTCHGPDQHEGRLRLDARAIVLRGGLSGPAVVPGDSASSILLRRLAGLDDAPQMPPDDEPLSDEQIGLVRAWIEQGAHWPDGVGADVQELPKHWAYVPPVRPPLPAVRQEGWIQQPIDHFVLSKLEAAGISPSPREDKSTLLRRVSLDLVGLPPTVEELEAFLADDSPAAYERVVERLLASPRYGERWARHWLDLVRYADSNGYQADQLRELWPYRDWVIRAMNADMPLDQFTLEQIAGDLLPQATQDQRIASGMHRATTCNVEAGVDPEENRVNQVIDRVNVTSTVWLGTTMECVQCHNHKYDPFTQRDYYGLFAFFNNTPLEVRLSKGVQYELAGPTLELPLPPEKISQREQLLAKQKSMQAQLDLLKQDSINKPAAKADKVASNTAARVAPGEAGMDAILVEECVVQSLRVPAAPLPVGTPPEPDDSDADLMQPSAAELAQKSAARAAEMKRLETELANVRKQLDAIRPVAMPVMEELKQPRSTHIFKRGNFLTPGAAVTPRTPTELHPLPADAPRNRVGLARWLVCKENPLVGRVMVNRWWAELFGQGLVATLEDFGTQGEPPTHRELLDYLAVELADGGWSMKRVLRSIVLSATYQQVSAIRPDLSDRDPENKLLARGPRFRLPAETIRDNALVISGLLSSKMGGPPVFPPQPPGIWRHVGRNAPVYEVSGGEDRFRRGIYVIWRRSAPYASFVNFDAPDRAAACIKRPRTNTPLQALTLMNDPAYLEMAIALSERLRADLPEASVADRINYGYRRAVARQANAEELATLEQLYVAQRARYQRDPLAAKQLLVQAKGAAAVKVDELSHDELADCAAWFFVATVLLNLDETITKQ